MRERLPRTEGTPRGARGCGCTCGWGRTLEEGEEASVGIVVVLSVDVGGGVVVELFAGAEGAVGEEAGGDFSSSFCCT